MCFPHTYLLTFNFFTAISPLWWQEIVWPRFVKLFNANKCVSFSAVTCKAQNPLAWTRSWFGLQNTCRHVAHGMTTNQQTEEDGGMGGGEKKDFSQYKVMSCSPFQYTVTQTSVPVDSKQLTASHSILVFLSLWQEVKDGETQSSGNSIVTASWLKISQMVSKDFPSATCPVGLEEEWGGMGWGSRWSDWSRALPGMMNESLRGH